MKILIIHASAGQGHKRAAEAIYDLLKQTTRHSVSIIDSLDYTNFLFKFLYVKGYAFLATHFPSVWGFFYRLTDNPHNKLLNNFFRFFNENLNSVKLRRFLIKEDFDLIIATHFFANAVISHLKEKELIRSRYICVVTDFLVHYYWIADGVDTYVAASGEAKQQLLAQAIAQARIKVIGIPIDSKFYLNLERAELCKKLNLNPDKFSVLIATGAFGFSSIETIVKLLENDVQLLIICGNNTKLLLKLSAYKYNANLKIFGFVKNMHELMAVADIIITKPGGLTISEALVKNLPMVFIYPIPGQETNNAQFLERQGLGITAQNFIQIKEIILRFKNNKEYFEEFKNRLAQFSKVNAAKEILNLIQ